MREVRGRENLQGPHVKDVGGPEPSNHAKEAEDSLVQDGVDGERASEEVDSRPGGAAMESEEALEGGFVVEGEELNLGLCEGEGREATEEDGEAHHALHP